MHAFVAATAPDLPPGIDTLIIQPDTSIGIEEVRQIQHFLSRRPLQAEQNTVIVLQAHLLTLPAQNALLKTLEEPPGNGLVYLITPYPDQLIPTVLSRVSRVESMTKTKVDEKEVKNATKLLEKLMAAGVGERLKILEEQGFTRETALIFLDNLEHLIHQNLSLAALYSQLSQTRKYLKANCNVKLALDCLVMSLES